MWQCVRGVRVCFGCCSLGFVSALGSKPIQFVCRGLWVVYMWEWLMKSLLLRADNLNLEGRVVFGGSSHLGSGRYNVFVVVEGWHEYFMYNIIGSIGVASLCGGSMSGCGLS